ncbi:MAG: bifunctional DNA primase/polymerase [Actinomycetota bacterium]
MHTTPPPIATSHVPTPSPDQLLRAATWYAARGWHVFPLVVGTKRPAITAWPALASTDPAQLARWWASTPHGIGIATGPSGLVVIDLDLPKPGATAPPPWQDAPGIRDGADVLAALAGAAGAPFPTGTHTVATASGGTHLYFRHPTNSADPGRELRNTTGALGWLIDTRAHGGYVVAAGTVVAGRQYLTLDPSPPAPLPPWLTSALTPPPARRPAPGPGISGRSGRSVLSARYVQAAVDGEARRVATATPGGRNTALFLSAVALGQLVGAGLLDQEGAADVLREAARPHLSETFTAAETETTIRSGLTRGTAEPRHLPNTQHSPTTHLEEGTNR